MRFRTGVVAGLAVGYYYGAKAGRERFEQLDRMLHRVGAADSIDLAAQKARAVIDLGVERARDLVTSSATPPAATALPLRSARERLRPPADPSLN